MPNMKTELVYHQHYQTRQEARENIFEYLEVFYNRKRLHSYCHYLPPLQYKQNYALTA
jgi:transposase InsO family protein